MCLCRVLGTGSALPEKVITNADLEKIVDTSDQWITDRTGIHLNAAKLPPMRPPQRFRCRLRGTLWRALG